MRRIIVPLAERTHVAERGDADLEDRRLRAARQDHVALPGRDQPQRVVERDHGRGTGGHLGHDRPREADSMLSMQAAIEPERAGIANGETKRGPRSCRTCVPSTICSIPPPPVFTTTPNRSRASWSSVALSLIHISEPT